MRLIEIYFPSATQSLSGEGQVVYETTPMRVLSILGYPDTDVPYPQESKNVSFSPIVVSESRLEKMRAGQCIIIEGNALYRINDVEAGEHHVAEVEALDLDYTPTEVAEFRQNVANMYSMAV